jgi:HK97 family phage major capsid protein
VEWLAGKAGQQFGAAEGLAFVNRTGVGQPRGFNTYPTEATADAARAWGKFEHFNAVKVLTFA